MNKNSGNTLNGDFHILDCTLRDGSYVHNFQFTSKDTEFIFSNLQNFGIKYIEIGHGRGLGAYRTASSSITSDEEHLIAASKVKSNAYCGMFCIPGLGTLEDIDLAYAYKMDFIRIGANLEEVEKTAPFIERAKKYGMFVCVNYMKSYTADPVIFAQKAQLSIKYGANLVYLVDSAGGMLPDELIQYLDVLKDTVDIPFGFHGHNNLGLASANSLIAQKKGAYLIDTTLQGLGRGAGNASTEQVVLALYSAGIDLGIDVNQLIDFSYENIQPLLLQKGLSPIDLISGYAKFHSDYTPVINKYAAQYGVDPKKLIIELCKITQLNAPKELVKEIALKLS
jgi:4-hydroxy-2-oxovalerate aldolase